MRTEPKPYLEGSTIYLLQQGFPQVDEQGNKTYGRVRVSTGLTIEPGMWDKEVRRPCTFWNQKDMFALHKKVGEAVKKMEAAYSYCRAEGKLTPDEVRGVFESLIDRPEPVRIQPKKRDVTVVELLLEIESRMIPATRKQNAAFRSKVEAYEGSRETKMKDVDDAWRDGLFAHIAANHTLLENTWWNQQRYWRKLLLFAQSKRIAVNATKLKKYRFTTATSDWLDWSDLKRIIDHPLRGVKARRLDEARTIVLTGALSSIRIGDYRKFWEGMGVRNSIPCSLFRASKKPNPLVCPPIMLPLQAQIRRAGIPVPRSQQGIRLAIQDLVDEVGLNKEISPHALRRSAITNLLSGCPEIPPRIIASVMSGHKLGISSEMRVFEGYCQSTVSADLAVLVRILKEIPAERTGGLKLM